MEYENKFFSKNSEKSFKILRQKHLSKEQNFNSKSQSTLKVQLDGLKTISTGIELPPNLEVEFGNLTIDSEMNINKKISQKSKLANDAENYYKIPTLQNSRTNKNT